ncbi:hypothetical protein [Pseudaeromonas pectinilytica]
MDRIIIATVTAVHRLHQQGSGAAIATMVLMPQHQGMIPTPCTARDNYPEAVL